MGEAAGEAEAMLGVWSTNAWRRSHGKGAVWVPARTLSLGQGPKKASQLRLEAQGPSQGEGRAPGPGELFTAAAHGGRAELECGTEEGGTLCGWS